MFRHTVLFARFAGLFFISTRLVSCQSYSVPAADAGPAYFPLEPGHYVLYDVIEERFSAGAPPVQQSYQVKEVVGPAYSDVTGQPAYRLLRYRRPAESQPWTTDSTWSARRTANEAIRTENGLDFVALTFPVSNGLRWNGNRHNVLAEDPCELRNSGQPYRVSFQQFDATVTVVAQDDSTLLNRDKRLAVYARQVGLIYRERTHLQYCSSSPACIGKAQIEYGTRFIYRIRQYGQE